MSISELLVPNSYSIYANDLTLNSGSIISNNGKIQNLSGTVTTIEPGSTQVTCIVIPVNLLQVENYFTIFMTSGINSIGQSCSTWTLYRITASGGTLNAPVVVGTSQEDISSFPVGTVGQVVSSSGSNISFQVKNTNASNFTKWTWNLQIVKASYPN